MAKNTKLSYVKKAMKAHGKGGPGVPGLTGNAPQGFTPPQPQAPQAPLLGPQYTQVGGSMNGAANLTAPPIGAKNLIGPGMSAGNPFVSGGKMAPVTAGQNLPNGGWGDQTTPMKGLPMHKAGDPEMEGAPSPRPASAPRSGGVFGGPASPRQVAMPGQKPSGKTPKMKSLKNSVNKAAK